MAAKVLFQELCVDKLGWDDPLPGDKASRWEAWLRKLQEVGRISISRCLIDKTRGEILSCQLHGFGDASKKAYCAVVYLVYQTNTGTYTQLLCSKSRVAPLKTLSIPRLELMSARILSVLMNTVVAALSSQVRIDNSRYWLDSKAALFWIANNGVWQQFVQHRVNEILTLTNKVEWRHVDGVENPADIGSRGVTASQLRDSALWWEGPKWLRENEEVWPQSVNNENSEVVNEERRKTNVFSVCSENHLSVGQIIDIIGSAL